MDEQMPLSRDENNAPLQWTGGQQTEATRLPTYDVSIILNLHNEARYLRRTLLSLEAAVLYARPFDITFEIIVVLDNADAATTAIAESHDYLIFDGHKILHVDNKSLGISRNDGISISSGDFITTADGDDLISFDFLRNMYFTAFSYRNSIILPEYCCGFGQKNYIWKTYPGNSVGFSALFDGHPYLSRIMASRDLFDRVKYADNSKDSGYHFEDWHFSCECAAIGWSFRVARGAVLFYRQRQDSLMRAPNAAETRLIAPSRFFEPTHFLKRAWAECTDAKDEEAPPAPFIRDDFLTHPGMSELVYAVNKIDPMVSMGILRYAEVGTNLSIPKIGGLAYFELCKQVAGNVFSDVLIVPFMAKGGAEKYILNVIEAIREHSPESRLLILSTQQFENHEWIDKLPEGSLFVDLWNLGHPVNSDTVELISLRIIQHAKGVKRLHLKNCEFVDRFVRNYLRYLDGIDVTYYHFCDTHVVFDNLYFENGHSFDLVVESGSMLSRVISDHNRNLSSLRKLVGAQILPNLVPIYNFCEIPDAPRSISRSPTFRLLWASRLDEQKRPQLALKIAAALCDKGIDVHIDAYGGTTFGLIGPNVFSGSTHITYCGQFDGFSAISAEKYDAFLYTASFDGLPNIVLEAMASELPVITADVGGINEAVNDLTGYLLENDSEKGLVEKYLEAIEKIYSDWASHIERGRMSRELISRQHSKTAFWDGVREAFALSPANIPAEWPIVERDADNGG